MNSSDPPSGAETAGAATETADLLCRTEDGVRTLTLHRPHVRNAMNVALRRQLDRELSLAEDDLEVRVVVLAGADGHFCAGGDINEMDTSRDAQSAYEYLQDVAQPVFSRMRAMGTPLIARVDGVAAGAGMCLALGCDVVIASTRATFIASQLRLGVPPDWGGVWLLPRLIGMSRAKALLLTGRALDAATAQSWGMVTETVAPAELDEVVRGYCEDFKRMPRFALATTRRAVDRSLDTDLQSYLDWEASTAGLLLLTDEHRERVRAFLDSRNQRGRNGEKGMANGRSDS